MEKIKQNNKRANLVIKKIEVQNHDLSRLNREVLKPYFTKNYEIHKTEVWTNNDSFICVDTYGSEIFCIYRTGYNFFPSIKDCIERSNFKFTYEDHEGDEFDSTLYGLIAYNFPFIEEAAIYSKNKFLKELSVKK